MAAVSTREQQFAQVAHSDGFIAALDQSAGSAPRALRLYGIDPDQCRSDAEVMDRMHEFRERVMTHPSFTGSRIIAAILFEGTMDRQLGGLPAAQYLWEQKRVVPFLKIDKGLMEEAHGSQLMKDMPGLEDLLDRASSAGVFGTKARSVIRRAEKEGVRAAVRQQFEVAQRVLAKGLLPILEVEVDIHAQDKELAEWWLLDELLSGLRELRQDQKVMFKLTPPQHANLYLPLASHPNTVRVAALSGGHSRDEACKLLAQNANVVASFSRAFLEGMQVTQSEEEFSEAMERSCEAIYQASRAVLPENEQWLKVVHQDGFFAALDQSGGSTPKALKLYGVEESSYANDAEMLDRVHDMRSRIITSPVFNGSRIIGTILFEATMDRDIGGMPAARYLWERKRVVPFLKIDKGLVAEKDGVQLMKNLPDLDALLDKAARAGIFGTKARSVIKGPHATGIRLAVEQQFEIGRQVIAKGLVPILEPEVDINAPEKERCEELLFEALKANLSKLGRGDRVIFKLTLPTRPNLYLPLMAHPSTVRVLALSGGYSRAQACELLAQNVGMAASFSRALTEGLLLTQTDEEFRKVLDESCEAIFHASRAAPSKVEQMVKMRSQDGFIAALDQSGGSTPKALGLYGISESEYAGEAAMMDRVHEMRTRIFTSPKFNGVRVIGAILFEATMDRDVAGMPSATYLWEKKRVVPFLKIDKGLAEESRGVRLMKGISGLEETLQKAVRAGIFGTKARSVIRQPNAEGIRAAVEQQFDVGKRVMAHSLVPILEPEVDIHAEDKAHCDWLLLTALMAGLGRLAANEKVIFKLTLPTEPNLFLPLIAHPNTVRVVALSGGHDRTQACKLLAQNVGVVASFSRAFLEGLHVKQTEEEFDYALDESCETIYKASRASPVKVEQMTKVESQDGFFVAFDQCASSAPRAAKSFGIPDSAYANEREVVQRVLDMQRRIMTNPAFNGTRVLGAILSEAAVDCELEGLPAARYLWEKKRVVSFLRIDVALQDGSTGVQLMEDVPDFDELLDRAAKRGVFGVKARAVITAANSLGIRALVKQQIEIANKACARGLVPILEPEVDNQAPEKALCEEMLRSELVTGLSTLEGAGRVMLRLMLPTNPGLYAALVRSQPHAVQPRTIRMMASSGGCGRAHACELLAKNVGMVAAFGRAFAEGLKADQTEEEFTRILDESCEAILHASRTASERPQSVALGGA